MSLKLNVNGVDIKMKMSNFPAGETFLRLEQSVTDVVLFTGDPVIVEITLKFQSNEDIIGLFMLVDAVKRELIGNKLQMILNMPYLPYAQQDRVCSKGESLSVKVICDMINSLNFDEVYVKDIHSDVGAGMLNNLIHITQAECAQNLFSRWHFIPKDTILVSPDAGSNKKVFAFAKDFGYNHVVRADKTRNPTTGEITGTEVYSEHVGDKDFLIMDDICVGGRTFIELAKKLRPLTTGQIVLYVTHGVFSNGMEELKQYIDLFYVSNLIGNPDDSIVII